MLAMRRPKAEPKIRQMIRNSANWMEPEED